MYTWTLKHHTAANTNLLDPNKVTQGYIFEDDGTTEVNAFNAYSGFIPVNAGSTYKVNFNGAGSVYRSCFFDINKNYVPGGNHSSFSTVTIPTDVKYIIITFLSIIADFDPNDISFSLGSSSVYEAYFESIEVHPLGFKTLSRDWEKQSGFQFYREKLNGNIKLINREYDYIKALAFDQELFIELTDTTETLPIYKGKFFKTDCRWDDDDRTIDIKLETDDDYEDFLGSLDKTFNLIELAPEIEAITIRKRPITQVYIAGDNLITNLLGGTYWEQPIQTEPIFDDFELTDTYHFYNSQNIRIVPASYAADLSTDITGEYNSTRFNVNGLYKIIEQTDTVFDAFTRYRYLLKRVSDNVTLYQTEWTWIDKPSINHLPFEGVGGQTGTFYFTEYRIYVRLASDSPTVFDPPENTLAVPENDIIENNANYKRVAPYNVFNFSTYDHFTNVPTRFGRVPEGTPDSGKYYKEFLVDPSSGLSNPLPIASSNWKAVSLWFFGTNATRNTEFVEGRDFELRDAFPIGSVLKTLLLAIESPVVFEETDEHSKFLFAATNPISAFTYLDFEGALLTSSTVGNLSWYLTPKSNIVAGNYDQPAKKADINLGQVLNLFRDVFKCGWHIEDRKLKIEHISFYQKGGTYYPDPIIGADLTLLTDLKTGKNWGFGQNKWEFDKGNMPERFEFSWMDKVSPAFEGFPIIMRSNYVQKGRIENINVSGITTDIDYILSNPGDVSKDGFVLIGTTIINSENRIPFIEKDLGNNKKVIMQNGFLSWPYLHFNFYSFDLPSFYINMNNVDTTIFNTCQEKKQEVRFPYVSMINPYKMVKTNLGNGIVDKMSINLHSLFIKATIKHDTE